MSKPDGDVHLLGLAEGMASQASLILRLTQEWQCDKTTTLRIEGALSRSMILASKAIEELRSKYYDAP